ncbi:MAG: 3-dehydroquinate synthase [Magnetococcales bacterium]|nr:3-dehydroquinate synthase [Magnetococcales bacterium]
MNDHRTLSLDLGPRSYDIVVGAGLLDSLGARLSPLLPGPQVAVVSNDTIAPLYMERMVASLKAAGLTPLEILLPDGEKYKDWHHLQTIFDALIENRFERSCTLLALGGGVVGDMTGYAAASFLRGVHFVQVPTTLLSQVDASVGGKTGINHPLGKNLIGAFYQPKLVGIDLDTLATLPRRELLAGLAEVIKYGIIWDGELFERIEKNLDGLLALDPALIGKIIYDCCAIKAEVVNLDEREAGTRALLNLGHTFGHAIESLAGYGVLLHGEGVAIGMVMAADLSQRMGLCSQGETQRIRTLLERAGLPVKAPRFPVENYLEAMTRDKKVTAGRIRFVVVDKIGKAHVTADAPVEMVSAAILENMVD